jgi:ribonucrease Y
MMTQMMTEMPWWIPSLLTLLGMAIGFYANTALQKARGASAHSSAENILAEARKEADALQREAKLQARDAVIKAREDFELQNAARRKELSALEDRLTQREMNLDRRLTLLENKEQTLDDKIAELSAEKETLIGKEHELEAVIEAEQGKIEEIAALSQEEARNRLVESMREELKAEEGAFIRRAVDEAHQNAEREARKIITLAIERYAAPQVSDITTSAVHLPSDEMKGRIIGREGRNIRSIEAVTGCNLLIDETPEVVVISCFDPLRRETARIVLERLIADGRIHPGRIEEVAEQVKEEMDEIVRNAGEEALYELGLRAVAPELVRTLGRLKFRTSYTQNVLKHSVEMGHLMGMMAAELNLDVDIAKRVGLFHDIGKALDHSIEGSHALIGADLLKKHGEAQVVVNAVASHHDEVEQESLYATLANAADAITAARPGARLENTELYLKRLEKLEEIAAGFRGVQKCYAIHAGREIRVIVEPAKITDNDAMQMARNICQRIQENVNYPGQVKVTVIRETRCIEYAK